ncbi:MAG: aminopeptidase [Lentisphaeria bacterium]|nr:aminopeptidase [Lentisphaeria bacterium]
MPNTNEFTTLNGWKTVQPKEQKTILNFASEYKDFLSVAKTERICHDLGIELAEARGYKNFDSLNNQRLTAGDKVYFSIHGKTLILAHIGEGPMTEGLQIIGGHTDSPRIDLKPRPLYEDSEMVMFDTHYYGGIKKYQWVTLPLALYGTVIKGNGDKINIAIGDGEDDPVFTITDLLPHLGQQQATKKLSEAFSGEALNVLAGSYCDTTKDATVKSTFLKLLKKEYGITEEDLISAELELVPAGLVRDLGLDRSMLLGYGHDDRVSVYTSIRGLLDLNKTPKRTAICILCDKEEIGSTGSSGMESYVFENAIAELLNACTQTYSELDLKRCLKRSKMLSADVNVLHDPNYPEVSSPNNNMAKLNHGVVLTKYTGSRGKVMTNDASAEYVGEVRKIFNDNKVYWQPGELGKVDQGGGGTIAYMLARYQMDVIDCGIGVLSMHAPHEVAGKFDIYQAYKAYKAFYQA